MRAIAVEQLAPLRRRLAAAEDQISYWKGEAARAYRERDAIRGAVLEKVTAPRKRRAKSYAQTPETRRIITQVLEDYGGRIKD